MSHMPCHEIEISLGLLSASLNWILCDIFLLRELFAHWIPHLLTKDQKQKGTDLCNFMMQKFDGGASKQVWDIGYLGHWILRKCSLRSSMVDCAFNVS